MPRMRQSSAILRRGSVRSKRLPWLVRLAQVAQLSAQRSALSGPEWGRCHQGRCRQCHLQLRIGAARPVVFGSRAQQALLASASADRQQEAVIAEWVRHRTSQPVRSEIALSVNDQVAAAPISRITSPTSCRSQPMMACARLVPPLITGVLTGTPSASAVVSVTSTANRVTLC